MAKKKGVQKYFIHLIIAVILITGLYITIFLNLITPRHSNNIRPQKNIINTPTSSFKATILPIPTHTPYPIKYKTYINNKSGFSIKYPEVTEALWTGCDVNSQSSGMTSGIIPTKLIEDPSNDTIYLTVTKYAHVDMIKTANSMVNDPTSCKVEEVNLNLVKNGYTQKPYGPNYPKHTKFIYKQINNDKDLSAFAQEVYGDKCNNITKIPSNELKGIYNIEFNNRNPDTGCWIGAVIRFIYSPKNRLAVTWILGHEPPYQIYGQVHELEVNFLQH